MIKPNGLEKRLIGRIITRFEDAGLNLAALSMFRFEEQRAREFYAEHRDREFYGRLIKFMTSGPVVAMCVTGPNVVEKVRGLVGATNPAEAVSGTIRADFATDQTKNVIHASDSLESAEREYGFIFGNTEPLTY
jgi:nucleoside-diphosphate kinase